METLPAILEAIPSKHLNLIEDMANKVVDVGGIGAVGEMSLQLVAIAKVAGLAKVELIDVLEKVWEYDDRRKEKA